MVDDKEQRTKTENKNPYDLCTWRDSSNCKGCNLNENLNCRFNGLNKSSLIFGLSFFLYLVPVLIGMIWSNLVIYIIFWVIYTIFFFQFWEIRVLCRHCPFWSEGGKILHCFANYGFYKVWKYNPGPMTKWEKAQFLVGIAILMGYFIPFLVVYNQLLMLIITIIGIIFFFVNVFINHCPKCVNFSCPFNRVPKKIVDGYLKLNPVIKDAWEKKGYKIGN